MSSAAPEAGTRRPASVLRGGGASWPRGAFCAALAAELVALFLLAAACLAAVASGDRPRQVALGALLAAVPVVWFYGWRQVRYAGACRCAGLAGTAGSPAVMLVLPDGRDAVAGIASNWDLGGAALLLALRPGGVSMPRWLILHRGNTPGPALRAIRRAVRAGRR
ncbi:MULTISPECIES: hypothetical protein [unclassified Cupriavidus]|uniref:hypothetical protein n=1 Tax=unclassified Cupriavidus TaxID=2640874 RepID=UPI0012E9E993|nr:MULTISPECIES: hypothetical protein [unclassified Cupriavidus]